MRSRSHDLARAIGTKAEADYRRGDALEKRRKLDTSKNPDFSVRGRLGRVDAR